MNKIRLMLIAFVISITGFAISTPSFAVYYPPEQAIDMTVAKVQAAIDAMKNGGNAEAVADLIKDALDASKEINASDSVFVARTKASNVLKSARNHLKGGAAKEAEEELNKALQSFSNLKKML